MGFGGGVDYLFLYYQFCRHGINPETNGCTAAFDLK